MFCSKCGSKNDDNAAFCGACGAKLSSPLDGQNASVENVQVSGGVTAPVVTATATGSVNTVDGSTAAAVKRTGKIIGITVTILIVAVIVAAIATGGFGLMGLSVKDSVNDYSWKELSEISSKISEASDEASAIEIAKSWNLTTSDGKLDGSQVKEFQLKDGTSAKAQIAGFWHDDMVAGGKAGITFIFKDAIAVHDMNSSDSNNGGWEDSQLRSWLSIDGFNMLPDDLKENIIEVKKLTNNVGTTGDISSITETSDILWLYSTSEICGNVSWWLSRLSYYNGVINHEGSAYKLFQDMDVNSGGSFDVLVKYFNEQPYSWWERTPNPYDSSYFYLVGGDGEQFRGYQGNKASSVNGVVPGFCV